ncbi:MAG TPA: rod-binding protein [Syntrophorhabdaceae bacterium]|nr:rod-binding protein [Syntrophorhabdaceae bacterium]HPP05916.1 rod-binding protein [Syntrophorhabdaceae bacterium]
MSNEIKLGAMMNFQAPSASFYTSRILKNKTNLDASDIKNVAESFESYFLYVMLKEMEKTTNSSNKSYMRDIYMSIMYEKVGDYIAKKGIGIKDMIAEYLQKNIKVLKEKGDNSGK